MSVTAKTRSRRWTRGRSQTVSVVLVVWLLIGAVAAAQRGYFSGRDADCSRFGTIAANIAAGPLNYVGVNPKIACHTPRPSR